MLLSAILGDSKGSAEGSSPYPALEEREEGKGNTDHASSRQVRVLLEGHLDVKEDLLDAGDGQLGLELGRVGRDLGECFEDRGTRGNNVVSCAGLVPVAAVL